MTAEQDGLDPAKVQAEHEGNHGCFGWNHDPMRATWNKVTGAEGPLAGPCLPYRLAAHALDLHGKVARVENLFSGGPDTSCRTVWHEEPGLWGGRVECVEVPMADLRAALADPTPAALCPKVTPLESLTDRTCAKPEGHAGACLFAGHDGRTDLEVMPK